MDIRTLKYFLMVAREENITHAAKQLHLSQPALSKQLLELEQELGKQLFVRGKRKITLTEDGILLKKRAEEIITLFDKTEQEMLSDTSEIVGEITIGGSVLPEVLEVIHLYQKKYPKVKFNFYSNDADEIKQKLDNGTIDFAILLHPVDTEKYDSIPLKQTNQWGLLLPKDAPLAKQETIHPKDIKHIPLILHKRKELQRAISLWANQDIEQLNVVATYNIISGSPIPFVESRIGYLISNEMHIDSHSVCFRPLEPKLPLQYCFVWKRYAILTKASQKLLEMLQKK